jgi:hypothetical protein
MRRSAKAQLRGPRLVSSHHRELTSVGPGVGLAVGASVGDAVGDWAGRQRHKQTDAGQWPSRHGSLALEAGHERTAVGAAVGEAVGSSVGL